jgi:hypothetical protein
MRHLWLIVLGLALLTLACEPGDGVAIENHTDVRVGVFWNNHWGTLRPDKNPDLYVDPGQRRVGSRITSRPESSALRVLAFDFNRELLFCRTYEPHERGTERGFPTWTVMVVRGEITCDPPYDGSGYYS